MLQNQKDIKLIDCKDYIKNPKPNGYRSLHLILQIPIFMSDREEHVFVEVQIRTIAMDFWASLEHKTYYKYNQEVPQNLTDELKEAAVSVAKLDKKMENIHRKMNEFTGSANHEDDLQGLFVNNEKLHFPYEYLITDINK